MSSTNDDEIRQKKQALRKEIRARVKLLTKEDIQEQSLKVWERLFALPQYQSAKSVGLFLSMPNGEIKTDPVLHHAIQNGKSVYVPQVGQNFEKCDMELLKVVIEDPSSEEIFHKHWPRNKWGIPEPPSDMPVENAKPGDIDLLVMPGLGFDRKGNRLGQGKGYYDRFIARMTAYNTPLPLIAVALTPLLVDGDIPVNEYDRQMDMILMPDETIIPDQKLN
jgi:5-formyltetrahydrofolate cyclo-ligase